MNSFNNIVETTEECISLGEKFSQKINPGSIFGFIGDLASGKTTFIKGVLKGLNYPYTVSSPTFTLVNSYEADYNVIHADFYREPNIDRWNDFGFRELMFKNDLVLIEWANLIPDLLPQETKFIKFEHYKNKSRKIYSL